MLFSGENKFFESENPVFNCFNKVKDMVFMISTCENITALTTSNIFFNKKYFQKHFYFFKVSENDTNPTLEILPCKENEKYKNNSRVKILNNLFINKMVKFFH